MIDSYPIVSVIVPNFNHAKYLNLRLESILSQTYQNIELILLDDASTDDSLEILEGYSKLPNVRLIVNETNSGSTFKQWNKGVKMATGKYIWFAESDDIAAPEFLSKSIPLLEKNSNLGLVYTQSKKINETGDVIGLGFEGIWRLDPTRWFSDFTNNGLREIMDYLCLENTIPNASAVVIRKSIFDEVGGAKEQLKLHGDYVLWLDILMKSDIAYIAEPLNNYRFTSDSVRRKQAIGGFDIEERYIITKYMFEKLDFERRLIDKICFILVKLWIHPDRIRTPLARHLKIFNAASQVDPRLIYHLFKRLITGPFKLAYMKLIGYRRRTKILSSYPSR